MPKLICSTLLGGCGFTASAEKFHCGNGGRRICPECLDATVVALENDLPLHEIEPIDLHAIPAPADHTGIAQYEFNFA